MDDREKVLAVYPGAYLETSESPRGFTQYRVRQNVSMSLGGATTISRSGTGSGQDKVILVSLGNVCASESAAWASAARRLK